MFKLIDKKRLDLFIKNADEKFPDSFKYGIESMCLNFRHYDIFDNSALCSVHPADLTPLDFIPILQILFYLFQSTLDSALESTDKIVDKKVFFYYIATSNYF